MVKETTTHQGVCLCGAVKYNFELTEKKFTACHCVQCRTWGGGPLMSIVGAQNVKFETESCISVFNSSEWAERGFCKSCGTHLFYRLKQDQSYYLPIGPVKDSENFKLFLQVFIDQKPDSYSLKEETECLTGQQVFEMYMS